jgi:Na+/glutamate symporter
VTYTLLTIVFMCVSAGVGLARWRRAGNATIAAWLAVAMVVVQFVLLARG